MAEESGSKTIEKLSKRVAELETQVQGLASHHVDAGIAADGACLDYCSVPQLPPRELGPDVSVERARLIGYNDRIWANHTKLNYYFFEDDLWGAPQKQKDIVRKGFDTWENVGIGIPFEEVNSPDNAEIRIGFQRGDGYWSYLGRDVLHIGRSERTMNFGSDLTRDPRGVNVPVHEIGHTLGFPHEHQNPFAGIVWDEDEVYAYFSGPPNYWDRNTIYNNILKKIPQGQVEGSQWDLDSIMHYAFRAGLIEQPAALSNGHNPAPGLSDTDKAEVKSLYPPNGESYTQLRPFEAQRISLAPGEQADFTIKPTTTRKYWMQTFGYTDSVMVLFEKQNGEYVYIDGDDDSGWDRNARIRERLYASHTYALRIRLYYQWASGDMAVMLW